MEKQYFVYILANRYNNVLYIGVTNNLLRRTTEHKEGLSPSFSSRYNVNKLVYYEIFNNPVDAISREKQLKAGPRKRKVALVVSSNPGWRDLYTEIATSSASADSSQ